MWRQMTPHIMKGGERMNAASILLRSKKVGVRSFRDSASKYIRAHQPIVITEHGAPESVLLPYEDMLEIVDILDELQDEGLLKTIAEGRKAVKAGHAGVSVSKTLLKHLKSKKA